MTRGRSESNCKTCKSPIGNRKAVFHCVLCGDSLQLTPSCTGRSEKVIYGIQEVSQNSLHVCKTCVQNNQTDRVLDQIASTREGADFEALTRCAEEVKQKLAQIKTEVKAKPSPEPTKAYIPVWVKSQNQSIPKKTKELKTTKTASASLSSLNSRQESEENDMTKT